MGGEEEGEGGLHEGLQGRGGMCVPGDTTLPRAGALAVRDPSHRTESGRRGPVSAARVALRSTVYAPLANSWPRIAPSGKSAVWTFT
jgi:hypothetical protein